MSSPWRAWHFHFSAFNRVAGAAAVFLLIVALGGCATTEGTTNANKQRLAELRKQERSIREQLNNRFLDRPTREMLKDQLDSINREEALLQDLEGKKPRNRPRAPKNVPQWFDKQEY